MKILLVVATEQEVIKDKFKDCNILITGMGMINASIEITKELMQDKYDLVINMGVAGSFSKDYVIGDVVVEECCFCTPLICMQRCCASITIATPLGFKVSCKQSFIWSVNRS